MNWHAVRAFALFQIVWIVAAVGAARGLSWPGISAAAAAVGLHAASAKGRNGLLSIAAAGALGLLGESALAVFGLLCYSAPWPFEMLAPAWIVALWLAYGTTIAATRQAIGSWSLPTQAMLGALLGPLSYLAGEKCGALVLADPRWLSLLATALLWATAFPLLLYANGKLETARNPTFM